MVIEKEKTIVDFLKKVSPGTPLRTVIDDILRSDLGALIVFDAPELHQQTMFEGGFRINCRFTPQKLFELCKMDGAIIVSSDLKRILYANVLMIPDNTISTSETGTRHKAAEKTAKQANTLVIAVSERRKKTTLFFGKTKYFLKASEQLLRDLTSNVQVLEKQRELLDKSVNELNVLEMTEAISVNDVCKVIQRAEMILKISEGLKVSFTEIGKEGTVMHMRFRELIRGVQKIETEILRDYASVSLKRAEIILSNISFDGLLDFESLARLIIEKPIEESISPKGYRFLSHLTLSDKEVSAIVKTIGNLQRILSSQETDFEPILKNRASSIKEEISNLRGQILQGKVVC